MKNHFTIVLFITIFFSCQSNSEKRNSVISNDLLTIKYGDNADVVQFKMFEGLNWILSKDTINGGFSGNINIPNLNEAIFTYDIVVHNQDSLGKMVESEPRADLIKINELNAVKQGGKFLWIGEDRRLNYLKNDEISGMLITKTVRSKFLEEEREISVYTPKDASQDIPHIYLTDGTNVNDYALYVDHLITTKRIKPIKLIGIHASLTNRYEEYVKGGNDNLLFIKHEKFVFNEIMDSIDNATENWNGKRYIYGVSNGAAFGMYAGLNHPDLFEEVIAFSTVDYITPMAQMTNPIKFELEQYPYFYMGAGRYETNIFNDNVKFVNQMKENKLRFEFREFVSGHDYNGWKFEFLQYLEKRFNLKKAGD